MWSGACQSNYFTKSETFMSRASPAPSPSTRTEPRAATRKIWRRAGTRVWVLSRLAQRLGLATSTVQPCRSGEPIRPYEHPHPGAMIHVDVTKFGNIPSRGGTEWREGCTVRKNRSTTPDSPRLPNTIRQGVPRRATGATGELVLKHNGSAYRSGYGAMHVHRTLNKGRACARFYAMRRTPRSTPGLDPLNQRRWLRLLQAATPGFGFRVVSPTLRCSPLPHPRHKGG